MLNFCIVFVMGVAIGGQAFSPLIYTSPHFFSQFLIPLPHWMIVWYYCFNFVSIVILVLVKSNSLPTSPPPTSCPRKYCLATPLVCIRLLQNPPKDTAPATILSLNGTCPNYWAFKEFVPHFFLSYTHTLAPTHQQTYIVFKHLSKPFSFLPGNFRFGCHMTKLCHSYPLFRANSVKTTNLTPSAELPDCIIRLGWNVHTVEGVLHNLC